jgi:hypothetical protein
VRRSEVVRLRAVAVRRSEVVRLRAVAVLPCVAAQQHAPLEHVDLHLLVQFARIYLIDLNYSITLSRHCHRHQQLEQAQQELVATIRIEAARCSIIFSVAYDDSPFEAVQPRVVAKCEVCVEITRGEQNGQKFFLLCLCW